MSVRLVCLQSFVLIEFSPHLSSFHLLCVTCVLQELIMFHELYRIIIVFYKHFLPLLI